MKAIEGRESVWQKGPGGDEGRGVPPVYDQIAKLIVALKGLTASVCHCEYARLSRNG